MSLSLSHLSQPIFEQMLNSLSLVLDKAEEHAKARKIDPSVLLNSRLYPDMFPFTRQVQIACDFAKNTSSRLAGVDVPKYADDEQSFAALKERIAKTLAFLKTLDHVAIDNAVERDITFPVGPMSVTMKGQPYLLHFAMPNFYFHHSMAYAILRHNGVDIGKRDFLGTIPGFPKM
jgi:uncharacterized protein